MGAINSKSCFILQKEPASWEAHLTSAFTSNRTKELDSVLGNNAQRSAPPPDPTLSTSTQPPSGFDREPCLLGHSITLKTAKLLADQEVLKGGGHPAY